MRIDWEKVLMTAILIALLFLLLTSCGSRKVAKTEIKETEKTEVKEVTETKTDVTDNTKIVDTSTSDEIEIVPVDNSKPIVVNGKSFFNVKIKKSKIKKNIIIENKKNIVQVKKNTLKAKSSKSSNAKIKNIEKEQFNFLSLWWLILLILLVILYYLKYGFSLPNFFNKK